MSVVVIDYGLGNIFSLSQALRNIEAPFELSGDPARIAMSDRLILPGVGAFADAAAGLRSRNLIDAILTAASRRAIILGICVGCQLLMSRSEEFGVHDGLGLIEGDVLRLPAATDDAETQMRIPNVGWRRVTPTASQNDLFPDAPESMFYFVHSYAPFPKREDHVAAAVMMNGQRIPVAVRAGQILGVQFHPEKSGARGLALLRRFVEIDAPPN